jgi:low affinity Fe/Cu permease
MAQRHSGNGHSGGGNRHPGKLTEPPAAGLQHTHRGESFSRFAHETARLAGKPASFILATAAVVLWALTGPMFGYSDTWQLVINTSTTIITFLMVFLIQNTQNRDTLALQVKLSELIIAVQGAKNRLAAAEELSEEELERLHKEYSSRADAAMDHLEQRRAARQHKG